MKMQTLELAQLVFGLALIQLVLIILPSLWFGMIICIPCHYILEVCDFLILIFAEGLQLRDFHV